MTIWQVQLEGDVRNLEFLAGVFATGPRKVLRDERLSGYLYESDSFHSCSTSEEVEQLANGELAILSGTLKLERDARDGLKHGAVYRLGPTGGRDVFVRIHESLQVRVEMGAMTAVVSDAAGNVITQPGPPLAGAEAYAKYIAQAWLASKGREAVSPLHRADVARALRALCAAAQVER